MKAQDLRIGNIVEVDNEVTIIKSIYRDHIDNYIVEIENMNEYGLEDIKPIPLTEEWLVKLGFEVFKETKHRKYLKPNMVNFYIELNKNMRIISYDRRKKIDYVHQLQSLYRALTGEELTIK